MSHHLTSRRSFITQAATAGMGASLCTSAIADAGRVESTGPAAAAPAKTAKLSAYAYQSRIWIRADDDLVACYRAGPEQKYPYFYPLVGPATGLPMTDESGVPYPHHRSLFLACDHVNGGNYWQEGVERGQIVSRGPAVGADGDDRIVLTDTCDWRQPGGPTIMLDERRYTLSAPSAQLRLIDADVRLEAQVDIHITRTNHSFFSLRAARSLTPAAGGVLLNASGQRGEKATFGETADWCGYQATRLGVTEAVVLMEHPRNPWSPCRWFTRDYGFISPTPFFWLEADGWRLPAGQSVRVRYRVVIAGKAIAPDEMNRLHEDFAAGP